VQGWMGHAEPFTMGPAYTAATGARALLSGTPPIVAMVPLRCGLDLVERIGMPAIRAKSVLLTRFALDLADDLLAGAGVTVATPRADAERGGHVTLRRPDFRAVNDRLWAAGVIPDFRAPDGIRLGLAPLSTSFTEVLDGMLVLAREVAR
jgi:kynureninase